MLENQLFRYILELLFFIVLVWRCIFGRQSPQKNSQNINLKAPKKAFFFLSNKYVYLLKNVFLVLFGKIIK